MAKFSFLAIKGIPTLFWSSPRAHNLRPRVVTFLCLLIGLVVFGLGVALNFRANVGLNPWMVLSQGVMIVTGWSVGAATFAIGVLTLALWIPLRQIPGIGTITNAIVVSLVIELSYPYLPDAHTFVGGLVETVAGIYVVGLGSGIYLIANLGPGPRDGLMTGLQRVTGFPIAWVRCALEVTVVGVGWWLGGTVGIGTILFAVLIGPAVATNIYFLNWMFASMPQELPQENDAS